MKQMIPSNSNITASGHYSAVIYCNITSNNRNPASYFSKETPRRGNVILLCKRGSPHCLPGTVYRGYEDDNCFGGEIFGNLCGIYRSR